MSFRCGWGGCRALLYRVKICACGKPSAGINRRLIQNIFRTKRNLSQSATMASTYRSVASLLRFSDLCVTVEPSGARAHVNLPGIPLDYFDRTGSWNVSKLQGLLTLVRFYAYHTPSPESGGTFVEYDKLTEKVFTFMASTKTEFSREFYDLLDGATMPNLMVSVHLGYIGMSSLSSVAELYSKDSKEVFVKNVNQVVTVDKTTRKPTPLPDWWKDKYRSYVDGNQRLIVPVTPVPEQTHRFKIRALYADMDRYKHINYVAYIRYCFEAAMDACVHKAYTKFGSDILEYKVKSMQISYKGESLPGDELEIATWENKDNPYLLHFDIKKNGNSIFQNNIEYYTS